MKLIYSAFAFLALCGANIAPALTVESGSLAEEVQRLKLLAFPENSNLYVAPTSTQRDQFLNLVQTLLSGDVRKADSLAGKLKYALVRRTDSSTGVATYELREVLLNGRQTRGWGSFFFNLPYRKNSLIEVPHILADANTERLAAMVFEKCTAKALLVAGAHRNANGSGTADVAHLTSSVFQQVHKACTASSPVAAAWQIHGFSIANHPDFPADAGAVLSDGRGLVSEQILDVSAALGNNGISSYAYNTLLTSDPLNMAVNGDLSGQTFVSLGATMNEQRKYTQSLYGMFVHIELEWHVRESESLRVQTGEAIASAVDQGL